MWYVANSVTRLGDLLDIGKLFKAHGNNNFAQSAIFVNLSKSFILLEKSFLGNFYRHLAIFYWSHWLPNDYGNLAE